MNPRSPQDLEALIHRTLREAPGPRAPRSLEKRVMAELARRSALPWWRQSFVHWPSSARLVFLVLSASLAGLAITAVAEALRHGPADTWQHLVSRAQTAGHGLQTAGTALLSLFPPSWLYALAALGAAVAVAYLLLFGAGAAAYRFLWKTR